MTWRGGGERQQQEYARFHNTNKHVQPGQRSDTFNFDWMINSTDPGQQMVRAAELDGSELMMRVHRAATVGWRQVIKVGTISDDVDPDTPQRQTVTVVGTGARLPLAA